MITKTALSAKGILNYLKDGLTLKPLREVKQWEEGSRQ